MKIQSDALPSAAAVGPYKDLYIRESRSFDLDRDVCFWFLDVVSRWQPTTFRVGSPVVSDRLTAGSVLLPSSPRDDSGTIFAFSGSEFAPTHAFPSSF
jgi:hypothetical protein